MSKRVLLLSSVVLFSFNSFGEAVSCKVVMSQKSAKGSVIEKQTWNMIRPDHQMKADALVKIAKGKDGIESAIQKLTSDASPKELSDLLEASVGTIDRLTTSEWKQLTSVVAAKTQRRMRELNIFGLVDSKSVTDKTNEKLSKLENLNDREIQNQVADIREKINFLEDIKYVGKYDFQRRMEGEGAEKLYNVLQIPEIEIQGNTSDQLSAEVRKEISGKKITLKTLQYESQGLVIKVFKVEDANNGKIESLISATEPSYFAIVIAGTKPDARIEKVDKNLLWKLKGNAEQYFQGLTLSDGAYHIQSSSMFSMALFEKLGVDYNSRMGLHPMAYHEKKIKFGDEKTSFLNLELNKNISRRTEFVEEQIRWDTKISIPESKVPVPKDPTVTVENKINFRQQNTLWTDIKWFVGALFENF